MARFSLRRQRGHAWPPLSEDLMHTNHARAIIFSCTLLVLTTAAPSHAQGFISPLIGYDFGGNSGCPEITNCEDKRTNIGVALGSMGTILGFEEEFADARNFFGSVGTQSSSVITIMSNIMIVPAIGPVHPYLLAGLGLMKTHVEFTRSDVLSATNNSLAWDVGGGVTVLFTPHFGVRGDIRHFHSAKSFTIPFVGITPTDENLTFGRASAALVLAF
jgi:opacity protein-like surface antigen